MGTEELDANTVDSSTADGMSGVSDAGSPPAHEDVNQPDSSPGEGTDAQSTQDGEDYSSGLMGAIEEAAGTAGDEEQVDADGSDTSSESATDSGQESDSKDDSEKSDEEASEEETDEDGKKLPPFHKHPRWQEMVRERNDLKQKVESFQERASEYDKIHQFMESNGLSPDEVARSIRTMAMIRNNPAQAREVLAKELESLDQFVGKKLPDDLQREVEEGYMTQERAQELARLRNEHSMTRQQVETERRQREQVQEQARRQQTQQAQQQALEAQRNAVRNWEQQIRSRDPDYERIQPFVYKELRLMAQEQPARTPEEAVELAKQAHSRVKEQARRLAPRETVRPGPNSSQSSGTAGSSQTPSSMMEAVEQAAGLK